MSKTTQKLSQKLKVGIVGIIENKSSTTWVDPKTVFEPHPDPKNSLLGSLKAKKLPQN